MHLLWLSSQSRTIRGVIEEPTGELSLTDAQAAMTSGALTAGALVDAYLDRIDRVDRQGPSIRSIIEINPDASAIAMALDEERREHGRRGPLHGIPILLKANIDTADHMMTTAGSLALRASRPAEDATVVRRLRNAGAVILGKTNLSEWANFRSPHSSSGWSALGGQTRNPHVLDRGPCGSSSGSAAAVAADLAAAALGTETIGSVVCPSAVCGIVGIKPTVGLTSRAGVIPISRSQDSVGIHARSVADAAAVLGPLTGIDTRDEATHADQAVFYSDYTQFLDPRGLSGARIGVTRAPYFGYSDHADRIAYSAVAAMRDAGAVIVDSIDIPTTTEMRADRVDILVMLHEFKAGLNEYLRARSDPEVRTLEGLIAFNQLHADLEMRFFGQERLIEAQSKGPLTDRVYRDALFRSRDLSRSRGLDAALDRFELDALVAPTFYPAWLTDRANGDRATFLSGSAQPAAMAGYPLITVPAGFAFEHLPVGITFMGRAWSEPTLLKISYAFEQATLARRRPKFLPTLII